MTAHRGISYRRPVISGRGAGAGNPLRCIGSAVREGRDGRGDRPAVQTTLHQRFPLGRLFVTPGALELLRARMNRGRPYSVQQAAATADPLALVVPYVGRHSACDWGDLGDNDRAANEAALMNGERLLSAYDVGDGDRLWIITEADRSSTTVLLPSEY
jgi:hypothetical protein